MFSVIYKSVQEVKDDCLYILDINVILTPFDTGKENLEDISNIFLKLKKEERLFIPAQVAREFASNRANRIENIHKQINTLKDHLNTGNFVINTPFLELNSEFIELQSYLSQIRDLITYSKIKIKDVINYIHTWNGNDFVSEKYREIFTSDIIIELEIGSEDFQKYFDFKSKNKVAPGFKDSSKDDGGKGNVIIWRTILEIDKNKNRHIIFVTNEVKRDWFSIHDKATGKGSIPKYELLDEYRREVSGQSINFLNFKQFLELLNAKEGTIQEIAKINDSDVPKTEIERIADELKETDIEIWGIEEHLADLSQDRSVSLIGNYSDKKLEEHLHKVKQNEQRLDFLNQKKELLTAKYNLIKDY